VMIGILLAMLFSVICALAQPRRNKSKKEAAQKLQSRFGLTNQQMQELSPVIQQEIKKLQNVYAAYNDQDDEEFMLGWSDPGLWLKLKNDRKEMEAGMKGSFTPTQAEAMHKTCSKMENEMLSMLLDDQIALLSDQLELRPEQSDQVSAIIARSNKKKQDLLSVSTAQSGAGAFQERVNAISVDAENQLAKVLTPEQQTDYQDLKRRADSKRLRFWAAVPSGGDSPTQGADVAGSGTPSPAANGQGKKGGEFVIAPIPVINPTLENGLAIGGGYIFQLDKNDRVSRPSVVGGLYFRTSNGSTGLFGGGLLHLKEDRFRVSFAAGKADININFFGIGTAAGDSGLSIPLTLKSKVLLLEGLVRLHGKWYLGPRYHILKMTASINSERADVSGNASPVIPPLDVKLRTAAIGPHLKYDGSNDQFYPTAGTIFDLKTSFYGSLVGGNRTYQAYELSYNKYTSLSKKQVLALRLAGCSEYGKPPFYDLCTLGLRGYEAGQYLDRNMISGQIEFRQDLFWRLGIVGFAGVGSVARELDRFASEKALPSGGGGIRLRLTKRNHVNLRADYAWGRNSSGLYLGVTEAF